MPGIDDWYLSVPEAALRLGVSCSAVYGRVRRGVIPGVMTGRGIRIPLAAFQQYQRRVLGERSVTTLVRD